MSQTRAWCILRRYPRQIRQRWPPDRSDLFTAAHGNGSAGRLARRIDRRGWVRNSSYDDLGRVTHLTQDSPVSGNTVAEKRVDFAYDDAGRYTTITRYKDLDGGGANEVAVSTYTFDDTARLTDLVHAQGATTFADYDWVYDRAGRIIDMDFTSLSGSDGDSAFTYDDTNQLTDADHTITGLDDEQYDYTLTLTFESQAGGQTIETTARSGDFDYEVTLNELCSSEMETVPERIVVTKVEVVKKLQERDRRQ